MCVYIYIYIYVVRRDPKGGFNKGGFSNLSIFQAEGKANNTTSGPSHVHYDGTLPNQRPPLY